MGKASGERRSKEQAAGLPVAAVKIRVISVSVTQSFWFPVPSIGYPWACRASPTRDRRAVPVTGYFRTKPRQCLIEFALNAKVRYFQLEIQTYYSERFYKRNMYDPVC